MNAELFSFESSALIGANRKGVITPDAHGYYTVIVGGVGIFNSRNEFYVDTGDDILARCPTISRRLQNKRLWAELEHPVILPQMSEHEIVSKILKINSDRVTSHIKEVFYDSNTERCPKTGKPIRLFVAKVKGFGNFKHYFEDAIVNPDQDLNYSIRSLVKTVPTARGVEKYITDISTFDQVMEPGLHVASKFRGNQTATESLFSLDRLDIGNMVKNMRSLSGAALENEETQIIRASLENALSYGKQNSSLKNYSW